MQSPAAGRSALGAPLTRSLASSLVVSAVKCGLKL
jgi:hypothetical protein